MKVLRSMVVGIALLAGCDSTGPGGERFFAVLSSLSETNPISTISGGTATVRLGTGSVAYTVTVQNITGVTAAHLHSGLAGEDGPVLITLFNGPTTGALTGNLVSGTITAANLTAVSMDSLQALVRAGHTYVNVYTVSRPMGEIRGQLTRQ